jgi:aspartate-semialdehyde dehydrogenase
MIKLSNKFREKHKMSYKIAVVGATGNVGREMLNILYEKNIPATEIVAIASRDSVGVEVSFGNVQTLKVLPLDSYDFTGTDIALFAISEEKAKVFAPKAALAGCVVIDNSSYFRHDQDVPLIIPEVNLAELVNYSKKNIIANPNCSTIQLLVALKPLHDLASIKRLVVSTYQSVSGAGKSAMDELYNQTKGVYVFSKQDPVNFTKQIAFNLIPHIDEFTPSGYTKEELKMARETNKILDPNIKVTTTCVRVPVFVGHSLSVNIEFQDPLSADAARAALKKAPGVLVVDEPAKDMYATPVEAVGEDFVYVSRIRQDQSIQNGLSMWIVADNLRKGAALNAVQITAELIKLISKN